MDNLGEINKCLEMYNVLRLNQEEIENTNKQIISNETESVKERKKKFPASKSPGSDGFMGEFYQCLKYQHQSFSNSSPKLKRKEHFQTHFMRPALP